MVDTSNIYMVSLDIICISVKHMLRKIDVSKSVFAAVYQKPTSIRAKESYWYR